MVDELSQMHIPAATRPFSNLVPIGTAAGPVSFEANKGDRLAACYFENAVHIDYMII
jgi:hypothetical protein